MNSFKDKVAWITGASSGIGEALAHSFAKRGAKLVLSSRREEELKRVQKEAGLDNSNSLILPLDLNEISKFDYALKACLTKFSKLDLLINNGGISQRSFVKDTELDVYRKIMEVNYFGNIALTQLVLKQFMIQQSGTIAVTSSVTGKIGTPLRSGYSASKHALHGFYDSLRSEVYKDNIKILIVCPGYIRTNVSINALVGDGSNYKIMDEAQAKGLSPEYCAEKIISAISSGKEEVIIAGSKEKFGLFLKRFFPGVLSKMMRNIKVT